MVAAAVFALTLLACESTSTGSVPSPTGPAGAAHVVVVTEKDRAVTLKVAQRLLLELHAKPGMTDWSGVKSSDTSRLEPLTIDVMVPRGVTLAEFQAISRGQVMVTAVAGPLCSPGQKCLAYVVLYSLRVTVVPT
jgi:hypothetical protein